MGVNLRASGSGFGIDVDRRSRLAPRCRTPNISIPRFSVSGKDAIGRLARWERLITLPLWICTYFHKKPRAHCAASRICPLIQVTGRQISNANDPFPSLPPVARSMLRWRMPSIRSSHDRSSGPIQTHPGHRVALKICGAIAMIWCTRACEKSLQRHDRWAGGRFGLL